MADSVVNESSAYSVLIGGVVVGVVGECSSDGLLAAVSMSVSFVMV